MKNAPKNPTLDAVRPNLMVELNERREALCRAGKTLHDFGVGDPREPTPELVREALRQAVPDSSQYPSPFGTPALRRACAGWLERRFGLALVFHALGRQGEANAALAELIEKDHAAMAYQIAQVYAYRGEADKAFEWLDRAYEQHDQGLTYFLRGDPLLVRIEGDPRYKAFLERMGLP